MIYDIDNWRGQVLEGWEGVFEKLSLWIAENAEVVLNAPCRKVARHSTSMGTVYSKLMWARNDGAIQKNEWISWLKWAYGPARSLHIWNISYKMMEKGHLCAVPVLAVRKKCSNGRHLNLLVTKEITAPTIEKAVLSGGTVAENAVRNAGIALAKLHKDNFLHGDYLPRNTCIQGNDVIFLDNDKSASWSIKPPFFLRKRNLDQFTYSLMVLSGLDELRLELPNIFIDAYCNESALATKTIKDTVFAKAKARWLNKQSREYFPQNTQNTQKDS